MKKFIFSALLLAHGAMSTAETITAGRDAGGTVGVGIAFSGPAGISLYRRAETGNFVQGALSFGRDGDFAVTGDYAFAGSFASAPRLTPYWGVGALVIHDENDRLLYSNNVREGSDETYIGARIPLGLNFVIPSTPVQLGGEIVPSVLLTPVTTAFVSAGAHVRVLF